jgi:6-pyruvoyltetrahydropterin/6-carboxytetrahydropterin synthase
LQYNQYRFKFYFNASHAIYLLGELGQSHPHTWEIVVNSVKITDGFVRFNEIETMIEAFLSRYQDVSINTVEPFTTTNPTLENICTYFKECIQDMLYEKGWLLLSIELSETPTRSFVISVTNELDRNEAFYNSQSEETLQEILDKVSAEKLKALIYLNATSSQEMDPDNCAQNTMKSQKAPDDGHSICSSIFRRPHTWKIIVKTIKTTDSLARFNEIENTIEAFLSCYQDVSIKTAEPFTPKNSSLENICTYFKECIQEMLYEKGWLLLSIQLSETPTRSHVIRVSNELERDETLLQEVFPDNQEQSTMKSQKAPEDRRSFSNRVISSIFRRNKF